jgi:hypothetical protein
LKMQGSGTHKQAMQRASCHRALLLKHEYYQTIFKNAPRSNLAVLKHMIGGERGLVVKP